MGAIKCVLAPNLNDLVRKGHLMPLDILAVSRFDVVEAMDDISDRAAYDVCVLQDVRVHPQRLQEKIVYTSDPHALSDDEAMDIEYGGDTNVRAACAVPLAGERLYYLPLTSDDYMSGWTEGAAASMLDPTALSEPLPRAPTSVCPEWVTDRQQVASLGARIEQKVKTIDTVRDLAASSPGGSSTAHPMVGVVQFKSALIHLGDPSASNALPFAFHIVLADRSHFVEVAFFGSACVRYFRAVAEGDLVQLSGYRAVASTHEPNKIEYFFEHNSIGTVRHVAASEWKSLVAQDVVQNHRRDLDETSSTLDSPDAAMYSTQVASYWLACKLLTSLEVQFWDASARGLQHRMYFDHVGVVSYVGYVQRNRSSQTTQSILSPSQLQSTADARSPGTAKMRMFRWIKTIDRSSRVEMAIQLDASTRPDIFYSLIAGDIVMLTKLTWVTDPSAQQVTSSEDQYQFECATTTQFSAMRANAEVQPFHCIEDCELTSFFAANTISTSKVLHSDEGESWLSGPTAEMHHPRYPFTAYIESLMALPKPQLSKVADLAAASDSLMLLEERHWVVQGAIQLIRAVPNGSVCVEVYDRNHPDHSKLMHLRRNALFQYEPMQSKYQAMAIDHSCASVLQLMPPQFLEGVYLAWKKSFSNRRLVLNGLAKILQGLSHRWMLSTRLYRDSDGRVHTWVEAIFK
ncbi:TPA: hypothetical protein N0F65_003586 [Lagenidium giganteum]|uniref:Telomeric single stranded DNA binding POT1/Cdc13 domain-containing protein n=1 Tax=Lagenidium giganteum TaxID=4803 RepID=A0AAV2Z5D4_9STRA|nr:TPA: hypothetical protein N0F65_003586 [Lagenidium giganteum]